MFVSKFLAILVILPACLVQAQVIDQNTTMIPYQAAIFLNGSFHCSGAIIANRCVVTSAQCAQGNPPSTLSIKAGLTELDDVNATTRAVIQVYRPAAFNLTTLDYDVAVLKLGSAVNVNGILPIALNSLSMAVGDLLQISGWGHVDSNVTVGANASLTYDVIPALGYALCQLQHPGSITNSMFCAAPASFPEACSADVGSPVVKDNKLYGLVTANICAGPTTSGVYTNIKQVLPFLTNVMTKYCA